MVARRVFAHREEVNALDDTAFGGSGRGDDGRRTTDDGRRSLYPGHPAHPGHPLHLAQRET